MFIGDYMKTSNKARLTAGRIFYSGSDSLGFAGKAEEPEKGMG
jgi:hypothetical protein